MPDDLMKPRTRRKAVGPEFGEWLKNARERQELSMRQLALIVPPDEAESEDAISAATISRLESGERNPSRRMVLRLAAALKVDPSDGLRLSGYANETDRRNTRRVVLPTGDVIEINPDDDEPQRTIDATAAFLAGWRARQTVKQ